MKRRGIFSLSVAAILVLTLLLFLIGFQMRMNQAAIVFTFGRASRVIRDPGLYWKWPYPVETVTRYDTRINVLRGKYDEGMTKDQHTIITTVAFGWAIKDPRAFYEGVGTIQNARERLSDLVGGAAKNVINGHTLAEFISTDPKTFRLGGVRNGIEEEIHKAVEDRAMKLYGVEVPFLKIVQLGFPPKVAEKVIEREKSERKERATAYRAQGDSEAQRIRAEADRIARTILSKAEAVAEAERAKGDAAAAAFYEPLAENPHLAAFIRELRAIQNITGRTTLILTTDDPIWRLLSDKALVPQAQKGKSTPRKPAKARGK